MKVIVCVKEKENGQRERERVNEVFTGQFTVIKTIKFSRKF